MYKIVTVAKAKVGKLPEAISGIKALTEYANSKLSFKMEVCAQLFGTAGTFYIISEYADVASAGAVTPKLFADQGYMALAQKLAEVVIDQPTTTLLQSI